MTISNKLTFARLMTAPVYFLLFWMDRLIHTPSATVIISLLLILIALFSELSDALDGKLARDRNEVTDFGKLFDPFADSVSRFTFFLCFWWIGLIPAWMIVLIFYRDASISFLRLVVRGENVVLAARKSGKIKAICQSVAIFMILGMRTLMFWYPGFPIKPFAWWTMLVVVLITVGSFFEYLIALQPVLKRIPK